MKEQKPLSIRFIVYPVLFVLAVAAYRNHTANSSTNHSTINNSQVRTIIVPPPNAIKVGELYAPYYVDENSKLKTIINNLKDRCSGNEVCEVNQAFSYVTHIPYVRSDKHRAPIDVITKNGGDCDEKAQLFAMILIETNHNCVLVYTQDHTFIAVEIDDASKVNPNNARLSIEGKAYYYAETTDPNAYIGKFNGVAFEQIQGVYHVNQKRNIPKSAIQFIKV